MTTWYWVYSVGYKDERDRLLEVFSSETEACDWIESQDPYLSLEYYIRIILKPSFPDGDE